jgi:hypothetical protein
MLSKNSKKKKKSIYQLIKSEVEKEIIHFVVFLICLLAFFGGLVEGLSKGSSDIFIALTISSFTLASLPLQLSEKYKENNRIDLSIGFIIAGLLFSTVFSFLILVALLAHFHFLF